MPLSVFGDEFFMKKALNEARRAFDDNEIPVGAIIVCNPPNAKTERVIIGTGYNQVEKLNDVTAHAEIIAITSACNFLGSKFLENCSIYVTLEPCLMCACAIQMAHISKIYYAAPDPKKGFSLYTPKIFPEKTNIKKGIMEAESVELLNVFFSKLRKPDR